MAAQTEYTVVIGLEVHAQLKTQTKIFCGCANRFGAPPNTLVCPVCLGLPGSLPVLNAQVLDFAVQAGFALDCSISRHSVMSRKNYFYPDLPKAYQISQYDQPLCANGHIAIELDGQSKVIGVTRIHIEEDAGKLIHSESGDHSFVDYNRGGVPLIEIVSEPDMRSSEEAYAYLSALKSILEYIEVSDCNMQEGSLRCDANVSLMPKGSKQFGTKAEIKNLNSFHGVQKAIDYEVQRQKALLDSGQQVVQETRLWDAEKEITASMRSKEEAHDYRYFPEPDLQVLRLENEAHLQQLQESLPELPQARKSRFLQDLQLPVYDAGVLTADKALADFFESCLKHLNQPKLLSNWVMGELLKELNKNSLSVQQSRVSPEQLADLVRRVQNQEISQQNAKDVFQEMFETGRSATDIIESQGLKQINDSDELRSMLQEIVEQNPKSVDDFKAGKKKAMGFFVGQVMYRTKGKANPQIVNQLLQEILS